MPQYLLVKDRLKGFRKAENQRYMAVVRRIGAVTFFRDRLNVIKPPARRIYIEVERQTKEFDQTVSEFGSTVFENNRKDSIRTISLPRKKAREGLENVIIKNLSFGDAVVGGRANSRICLVSSKIELVAKV